MEILFKTLIKDFCFIQHLNDPQEQPWSSTNAAEQPAHLALPKPWTLHSPSPPPPQTAPSDEPSTSAHQPSMPIPAPTSAKPLVTTAWLPGSRYHPSTTLPSVYDQLVSAMQSDAPPPNPQLHGKYLFILLFIYIYYKERRNNHVHHKQRFPICVLTSFEVTVVLR